MRIQPALRLVSEQPAEPEALCLGADPAALGLSLSGGRGRPGTESRGTGSEVLRLWVEQLVSAPKDLGGFRCGRPSGVSRMGPVR